MQKGGLYSIDLPMIISKLFRGPLQRTRMETINTNLMEELHIKRNIRLGWKFSVLIAFCSCFALPGNYLVRRSYLPSTQLCVQQRNGEIASLVDFEAKNISFSAIWVHLHII